ncbi:T9SS type A sorting domain-containing protein [Lacinutrix iliipiscaria]|uniref:T9SS type A sorting domain-containing protein n=1 Tax=Lacinutrix iliipiscaria TaxID=1230532 RepID=A0ABW5WPK3_9FLAO
MNKFTLLIFSFILLLTSPVFAQHSVAREWNEEILNAIRLDFARPTVHARNLFHTSAVMYDAWAIFDEQAETVFLGKTFDGYTMDFEGIATPTDIDAARHEVISYAIFNLIKHRFQDSPNYFSDIYPSIVILFQSYGYDIDFTSTDYSSDSYAALGNYMASQMIAFGLQDGSNEENQYANINYLPTNEPLILDLYEDNTGIDPNSWQPLAFDVFIDQSGNTLPLSVPPFLSPEWGKVGPFCLKNEDLNIYNDPGYDCYVYNDPGAPHYIQNSNEDGFDDPYKWHFALVAAWSSHLDPNDETMMDISPGSIGNFDSDNFPETFEEYKAFYNFEEGGDASTGHDLNPYTGEPYEVQMVKRADYGRVLAEFWADGPDSETPPGHWFTILNYVSDHPLIVKQMNGTGPELSDLEWDVKSYLTLGGAMHDSAVNTWGIKGFYDYIRPISAIRYMAGKGQSTDASRLSYDPHGLPLIPNFIEIVESGDPLAGAGDEYVGKIKIRAWKGPDYIDDPETDIAGVDWIYGENWWPYQRATFVTPPFAGYVSGHSTFSRAAAEVLTLLTGDEFFPGGMGTFDIEQNNFLVFEPGPTQNMTLQWATYRDASDQTSLSRIWGGIHPPIDDIRGRIIGEEIGIDAFNLATQYFDGSLHTDEYSEAESLISIYPNPASELLHIKTSLNEPLKVEIYSIEGKYVYNKMISNSISSIDISTMSSGLYFVKILNQNAENILIKKIIKN